MKKVSAKEMQELDRRAQEEFGIPGLILMENAGKRASEIAFAMQEQQKNKKIVIFCGPGNNGGDGFVLARHLLNNRQKVMVFLLADKEKIKGDALVNFNILLKMGLKINYLLSKEQLCSAKAKLKDAGLIVDAIFGIGLERVITGIFKEVINLININRKPVLSLDIPSGLCATKGKVWGTCVKAQTTITFGLAKKGFFIGEGPKYVGTLVVSDISLPRQLLKS